MIDYIFSVFPRSSGGKGPKNFGRWGSLKDRRQSSQVSLAGGGGAAGSGQAMRSGPSRLSADIDGAASEVAGGHILQKAALYILGEKAQMKGAKVIPAVKVPLI